MVDLHPYTSTEHQNFVLGKGPAGALLIHGFPGTPAEMRPLGEALAEVGFKAHGILLPGFGPEIPNLENCHRDDWLSAARSEWLDIQSTYRHRVLIGYSMGATLAVHLAAEIPPDKLILVAPFWRLPGYLPRLVPLLWRLYPRIHPFKKADFSDPQVRDQLGTILPDVNLDDLEVQQTIRDKFVLSLSSVNQLIRLGRESYHLAKSVVTEVLIIQGESDLLVVNKDTQKLGQRMLASKVQIYPINSDHRILGERSVASYEVIQAIINFLST